MEGKLVNFTNAVLNTHEIAGCLKTGLQALGGNRSKVDVGNTRQLEGRVDIDTCIKRIYPNDPRWDYVFGYKGKVYYVEVHEATIGEIGEVVKKFEWLKHWRKVVAERLEALEDVSSYHWVATKRVAISAKSDHRRKLAQKGIDGPKRMLRIPMAELVIEWKGIF